MRALRASTAVVALEALSILPAMKLTTYLEQAGLTQVEFSRLTGIDKATICSFLAGRKRRLSAENAAVVVEVTKGKVRFDEVWQPSLRHASSRPAKRAQR